jgi:hypothetical protein
MILSQVRKTTKRKKGTKEFFGKCENRKARGELKQQQQPCGRRFVNVIKSWQFFSRQNAANLSQILQKRFLLVCDEERRDIGAVLCTPGIEKEKKKERLLFFFFFFLFSSLFCDG